MIKNTLIVLLFMPFIAKSQIINNWQNLDPERDSVLGVSTYRAYELLKDKISKPVVVAIIDNGAELSHFDLAGQFWVNPNEIPDNRTDDDKNGYIDDINGWNFLGNALGQNIKRETTELTRLFGYLSKNIVTTDHKKSNKKEIEAFNKYQKIKRAYQEAVKEKKAEISFYEYLLNAILKADTVIKTYFDKDEYNIADLKSIPDTIKQKSAEINLMRRLLEVGLNISKIKSIIDNNKQDLETRLNPEFNIRKEIIGDNTDDLKDKFYGNNQVNAMSPYHGTGVAGIIAALYNNKGTDGIAKNVKLMIIRILPNGDENDKDVALAILYAIDNGADIINCSFGKSWSAHPDFVEFAIKKAERANVLIVHAAGNDARNNDSISIYPKGYYSNGKRAKNWICVGASMPKDNENLLATFSNYGKNSVDILAPGQDIYSCVLNNQFEPGSGTSLAAPVVSGIAAVIKSYYPKITAVKLKKILISSAYKPTVEKVLIPGKKNTKACLNEIMASGGIANLYRAIQLLESENQF